MNEVRDTPVGFLSLNEKTELDEVYRLLMAGNTGVVVLRNGTIRGLVTRIDLVDYWDQQRPEGGVGSLRDES